MNATTLTSPGGLGLGLGLGTTVTSGLFLSVILAVAVVVGFGRTEKRRRLAETEVDPTSAEVDAMVARWPWVDATFSTYRPDSQISRRDVGEEAAREPSIPRVNQTGGRPLIGSARLR